MPAPPIPVDRYLTPDTTPVAPDGFTSVVQNVATGLPLAIPLDADFTVIVAAPTGLASDWMEADPGLLLSSSDVQTNPWTDSPLTPVGSVERFSVRLLVQRRGVNVASAPLTAGLRVSIPGNGASDAGRMEIVVTSWNLRVGNMVGAGDYGASIALSWSRNDTAVPVYGPVPVSPFLRLRSPKLSLKSVYAESTISIIFKELRLTLPEVLR